MAISGYENQVSPIFLVALPYDSYSMSVMFTYCFIESHPKVFFLLPVLVCTKKELNYNDI